MNDDLREEELAPNCCAHHKAGYTLRHDCSDDRPKPLTPDQVNDKLRGLVIHALKNPGIPTDLNPNP